MEELHPLKREIYRKGYSIREFAMKADLDKVTLYKIFRGETKMATPKTMYKIADKLNIPYERVVSLVEGL